LTLNCDTTELETKGAVFIGSATKGTETIDCGLTSPTEWTGQEVTLTLEKVGADKITCTTKTTEKKFSCSTDNGVLGGDKIFKTIVQPDSSKNDEVKLIATLGTGITETTSLRCTVKVGSGDEEASDTKLIYVQKIRLGYQNDNYDRHQKLIKEKDDKLKVSVYGDDAFTLEAGSKCKLGSSGTDATFSSKKAEVVATVGVGCFFIAGPDINCAAERSGVSYSSS
jgi:hypothetical protein